jgi:general stress protein YciG
MLKSVISCKATNKKGVPCGAHATETGYCHLHSDPERAAQLGREGGKKNRHVVGSAARPLPGLDNITGVRDALAVMIEDVHANRMHPRTAGSVASLMNLLIRALEPAELEQRVKKLENEIAALSGGEKKPE